MKLTIIRITAPFLFPLLFGTPTLAERILLVETMPVPAISAHSAAFVETLMKNEKSAQYELVRFQADGDYTQALKFLESHAADNPPDLVVTFATLAAQAAVAVFGPESGVPVLFCVVVDPVGAGVIEEVGVPSATNVAGIVYTVDRETKIETTLQVLRSAPDFRGVTVGIPHSSYPSSRGDVAALQAAAGKYPEFRIIDVEFPYLPVPAGVPAMRRLMIENLRRAEPLVDFWWEAVGPMSELRDSVRTITQGSNRPVLLSSHTSGVADGALLSISPDSAASGRQLAGMALRILAGTDPGTIPILPAMNFHMALNLSTARALGVVPPSYLLEMAGERVYR